MSAVSRIEKMIHANRVGTESIEECSRVRAVPLQIILPADVSQKVEMMAIAAVELGLRTFLGPVEIYFMGQVIAPDQHPTKLLQKLHECEEFYGKPGRIHLKEGQSNSAHPTLGICVPEGIYADAAGWVASVNMKVPGSAGAEPPAAFFAVACAMAKVFQLFLIGKAETVEPFQFDVLSLRAPHAIPQIHDLCEVDLGTGVLFGAGATGNAFGFVLDFSKYKMSLKIVDDDAYEEPNEETSLMIGNYAVTQCKDKATYLASRMNRHGPEFASGLVEEVVFGSEVIKATMDFLIVGTDNSETRRMVDRTGAKVTLNAGLGGTSSSSGHVLLSIHEQGGYLLSQLYPDRKSTQSADGPVPKEFDDGECSRMSFHQVSLAAPFVALAGGALLVAALVARRLGVAQSANYFKLDLFGLLAFQDARKITAALSGASAVQAG